MNEFDARMAALAAALQAAAPARLVTRNYRDRDQIKDAALVQGVFTVISRGAGSFTNIPGRMAEFGTHRVLVTGQLKLDEHATGAEIEAAEFQMLDELREMTRAALPEAISGIGLLDFAQSGQQEAPYGWIAATLEIY